MSHYDIEYTHGPTGQSRTHPTSVDRAGAEGWMNSLQAENGGKATLYENAPIGGGSRREIASKGDPSDPAPSRRRF